MKIQDLRIGDDRSSELNGFKESILVYKDRIEMLDQSKPKSQPKGKYVGLLYETSGQDQAVFETRDKVEYQVNKGVIHHLMTKKERKKIYRENRKARK